MGLSGKKYDIAIFCFIDSCSITRILQENDVLLLHRAACKGIRFPCAENLPRLVQPPLNPLPGQAEPCSTSGAATPPFPTSPPHLPNPWTWKSNFLRHPSGIPIYHRKLRARPRSGYDKVWTNCRTNWQSSKQQKLDTILDA